MAEEAAGADHLRDIWRHHLLPRRISGLDPGERLARGEIQIFRAIILQRLDVAVLPEVGVEVAQMFGQLQVARRDQAGCFGGAVARQAHGGHIRVGGEPGMIVRIDLGPHRVDVEADRITEQPADRLEDATLLYGDPLTPNFLWYAGQRGLANRYYEKATTFVTIALVNHIVSAFDAAFSAASWNKKLQASLDTQAVPTAWGGMQEVPVVKLTYGL